MRKLFTLAIVFLASILQAEAGQVNEQEARQKAMSFMTKLDRSVKGICAAEDGKCDGIGERCTIVYL